VVYRIITIILCSLTLTNCALFISECDECAGELAEDAIIKEVKEIKEKPKK
jgi:hypothetical protein